MILTVGHSAHPAAEFAALLGGAGVEIVVDVRRHPVSRRNPQFRRDELERWLPLHGFVYRFAGRQLGGQREGSTDAHPALEPGFATYAEHMARPAFRSALREVVALADEQQVALMCAEADPRRCHRSLLADSLVLLEGVAVRHLLRDGSFSEHEVSPSVRREGDRLVYDVAVDRPLPFT